jgi:N6-L-threonylcarbamoyladenine synthase/protein kinase Bud32
VRLKRLEPSLIPALSAMLTSIEPTFRPFDFTVEAIAAAIKEGDEHWVIALPSGIVVAYGMLRGWSAGYRVPSLGVAVDLMYRRRGLAWAMCLFLHYRASERGCSHVMLHVDDENLGAQSLYRALGYRQEGDRWVAVL